VPEAREFLSFRPSGLRRVALRPELGLGVLLVALTLAVYGRAINFGFLAFDDPTYVTENFHVLRGLTLPGLRWAMTKVHDSNWVPLTWMSLMLDTTIYGPQAGGFHATNILLHVLNVLLVFALLTQATDCVLRSAFVAALFAVHPLHVESVAWIAERKDVLSMFFGLLSLWCYVRSAKRRRPVWLVPALACFVLSLSAKQTFVTLPFLCLLLDFWPLERLSTANAGALDAAGASHRVRIVTRLLVEKIPFFVITAISCRVAIWAQSTGHSVRTLAEMPLQVRLLNAIAAYGRYLDRTILPMRLSLCYPHPGRALTWSQVALPGLAVIAITALVLASVRRRPFLFVGWFWFLGSLVPMIGLVQVGLQQMADRYAYLPGLGLYLALAWLPPTIVVRPFVRRRVLPVLATGAVAAYAAVAYVELGYWRDGITLMRHGVASTGENAFGCAWLGQALRAEGHVDAAFAQFERVAELSPQEPFGLVTLGAMMYDLRRFGSAAQYYRAALALDERCAAAHGGLALALCGKQEFFEAQVEFERTLEIEPNNAASLAGLALLCRTFGKSEQSIAYAEQVLAIDDSVLHSQRLWAITLFDQGRLDEAIEHFRQLVAVAPNLDGVRADLEQAEAVKRGQVAPLAQ
jgi:tetratricopeptide (TPR) repeat protein